MWSYPVTRSHTSSWDMLGFRIYWPPLATAPSLHEVWESCGQAWQQTCRYIASQNPFHTLKQEFPISLVHTIFWSCTQTENQTKNAIICDVWESYWDFFKFLLPLYRCLPARSLYRVVVGFEWRRSSGVRGPKSKLAISRRLLQTHVRFQLKELYFLIQNAIL